MKRRVLRLFCLFLCMSLAICLVPGGLQIARAEDGIVEYAVTGGNIYIDKSTGTVTSGDWGVTSINIPNNVDGVPVTSIGAYAFYFNDNLSSVNIEEGVTSIGESAFCSCKNLTSINIPGSVTEIGSQAFAYCDGMSDISVSPANSVYSSFDGVLYDKNQTALLVFPCGKSGPCNIPSSVTSIDLATFDGRKGLTGFVVDEANSFFSSLDGVLFSKDGTELIRCPEGKSGSYTIPDGVVSIGDYAFYDCKDLVTVTIPNGVSRIGSWSFGYCSSLTGLKIPASVTYIGDGAFCIFDSFLAFEVDEANPSFCSVDGVLFNKNRTKLIRYPSGKAGKYTIPSSVTSIGEGAFENCVQLIGVTIPSSVIDIGDSAFNSCSSLTSLNVPDSVTNIGSYAFAYCDNLADVKLSNRLSRIAEGAFDGCSNLTSLNIPDSVTSIGSFAFMGCYSLSSLIIPEKVRQIETDTFWSCENLREVTIPARMDSIWGGAFYDCTNLKDVYYGNRQAKWEAISIDEWGNDALFSATLHCNESAIVPAIGDANNDGKVNAQDRVIFSRYLAKWHGYTEQIVDMDAMDINNDGFVNAKDRVILSRYLAKWGGEYEEYFK